MSRLLILTLALSASTVRAGGFGIPEIGVRRTAMGAIVGRPDDPSAIYHNPAGLALSHGTQLYVSCGVSLLDTQFSLAPWSDTLNDGTVVSSDQYLGQPGANGLYAPTKPTRAMGVIPMLAVTHELIADKLWIGGGVYVGNATGAAFDDQAVTRYHLITGYIIAPQAVATVAYRVLPSLTIGATAGVINLRVHGRRLFYPIIRNNDGTTTNATQLIGTAADLTLDGSAWAPTAVVGVFGQPHPRVTWGATVTMRTDATLEGPVTVKLGDPSPLVVDTNGDGVPDAADTLHGTQKTSQLLPWAVMAGANVDLTPHVELGGELRYWLYRQYQKQETDVTGIFLVRKLETTKNFHDSWETSGGVRVHDLPAIPALDLMMGLQWDHSPAPANTLTLDQPSFSHLGLHSGLRYTFGRYRVGASYIHYWYRIPSVDNSITVPPTNFAGQGSNNIFTASLEVRL